MSLEHVLCRANDKDREKRWQVLSSFLMLNNTKVLGTYKTIYGMIKMYKYRLFWFYTFLKTGRTIYEPGQDYCGKKQQDGI